MWIPGKENDGTIGIAGVGSPGSSKVIPSFAKIAFTTLPKGFRIRSTIPFTSYDSSPTIHHPRYITQLLKMSTMRKHTLGHLLIGQIFGK